MKIATFNCENLFARAAVLSTDIDSSTAMLDKVTELDQLIAKEAYSAADKQRMLTLIDELARVATINELRGHLLGHNDEGPTIVASGRRTWVGGIELAMRAIPIAAQVNTARVIDALDADIQIVVEVEDRRKLEDFNSTLTRPFPFNMLVDGNDKRGIDVGILSRYPFQQFRSHIFDAEQGQRIFSRDCLEVDIQVEGAMLHFLVNHLKSKSKAGGTTDEQNNALRERQARHVASIVDRYDLEKDYVIVVGDFNDTPDSKPLASLVQHDGLKNVVDRAKVRFTYYGGPKYGGSQIDYILVSKPLDDRVRDVAIERRGIASLAEKDKVDGNGSAIVPFDNIKPTTAASDHAGIVATFDLGGVTSSY